jgi:ATP-dependent Clp endopeptidase proteolytic subunit ClpP|tara:strand:+ start:868 stop:1533 length:666 start_codon:yes stop_codon:yes gene_type:complete
MTRYYWCDDKTKEKIEETSHDESGVTPIILMGASEGQGPVDSCVDISDNTIMFYGEVSERNAKFLNKAIRMLDKDLQVFKVKYDSNPPPIKLHINSYGGSIFAGLSTVDVILNCKTPVHSYIDGSAASAATLISVVADKRFIYQNSHMLIHQLTSSMWGKFEDFKDEMENLDMLMTKIKNIYKKSTTMSTRQITEILKRDKWFDAEKCVELGLVDEIVENG